MHSYPTTFTQGTHNLLGELTSYCPGAMKTFAALLMNIVWIMKMNPGNRQVAHHSKPELDHWITGSTSSVIPSPFCMPVL